MTRVEARVKETVPIRKIEYLKKRLPIKPRTRPRRIRKPPIR